MSTGSPDLGKSIRPRIERRGRFIPSNPAKALIALAAIGLIASVGAPCAHADVIEQSYTYLDVDGPVCVGHYSASGDIIGCAGPVSYGSGVAYGTTLISPDPTAIAAVDDPVASISNEHQVSTTLQYFFEVSGPGNNVEIDIGGTTVAYFTVDSGNADAGATTEGVVVGPNGYTDFGMTSVEGCTPIACSSLPPGTPGAYATGAQLATIGQPYEISITATASERGGGTAYASIDPTITIDGSVPDPGAYQITLSQGVGNPAPPPLGVPEPSSWALLILGLGGVGAARRAGGRSACAE